MAIRQEAPPTHLGLRDVNFREHLKVLKLVGASIMDPEHEPYDARQWQANLLRLALVDIRCAVPSARNRSGYSIFNFWKNSGGELIGEEPEAGLVINAVGAVYSGYCAHQQYGRAVDAPGLSRKRILQVQALLVGPAQQAINAGPCNNAEHEKVTLAAAFDLLAIRSAMLRAPDPVEVRANMAANMLMALSQQNEQPRR